MSYQDFKFIFYYVGSFDCLGTVSIGSDIAKTGREFEVKKWNKGDRVESLVISDGAIKIKAFAQLLKNVGKTSAKAGERFYNTAMNNPGKSFRIRDKNRQRSCVLKTYCTSIYKTSCTVFLYYW